MQNSPTPLDPKAIREKILLVAGQYLPKLPELISDGSKTAPPTLKMAVTVFRPFLPHFEQLFMGAIENASDEKLLAMVNYLGEVYAWLTSTSNQVSESPPSE